MKEGSESEFTFGLCCPLLFFLGSWFCNQCDLPVAGHRPPPLGSGFSLEMPFPHQATQATSPQPRCCCNVRPPAQCPACPRAVLARGAWGCLRVQAGGSRASCEDAAGPQRQLAGFLVPPSCSSDPCCTVITQLLCH